MKSETGVIAWMARNPIAANLLMLLVLIAGLGSLDPIRKEVFPSFPSEKVLVTVPYPSASPEEVEDGIVVRIEEEIQDLEGIKEIRSVAREGSAEITVVGVAGTDVNALLNKIKTRVDAIASFPQDAEKAVIEEKQRIAEVLNLSIYGDLTETQLSDIADAVREELLELKEVSQVEIHGVRAFQMAIEVSDRALRQYNLSFDQVVAKLREQSRDLPGGKLRTKDRTINLRTLAQARTAAEYESLVLISRADGGSVLLGDVAKVVDGFDEQQILSRYNGLPAVTLEVNQVGNEDALDIAEVVKKYVETKQAQLPKEVSIELWADRTNVLKGRIGLLVKNAYQGGLLVVLTLALFLNVRLAFWVVMGVPFCFLGAIMLMNTAVVDASISVISMFGFILVLGIIVDDAIVTAESAYANLELERQGVDSIVRGVKKVATATIFGVLTTMIAFLPMLFMQEGLGRFFGAMSAVVICCLFFSMIETKLILPSHLRHIHLHQGEAVGTWQKIQMRFSAALKNFAETKYQPVLHWAVANRYITLVGFICALMISLALVPGGFMRFVFFPSIPSDYINVSMTMPQGIAYQQTHEKALLVEAAAEKMAERFKRETGVDYAPYKTISTSSYSDTSAQIVLELVPSTQRDITSLELALWWREALGEQPGFKSINFDANAGIQTKPIDIEISHDDLEQLKVAAAELKRALNDYQGVADIGDSLELGSTDVLLQLTDAGRNLGLGEADLAKQVRQAFFGAEVQRIQRGRHEVRVYARLPMAQRQSLAALEELWINLPNGDKVPLASVAELKEQEGISQIKRFNRHRVVNVTADVDKSRVNPDDVLESLKNNELKQMLLDHPGMTYRFSGQAQAQRENTSTLFLGLILVMILIYAALAIPLGSYFQPLLIMSVIPFGLMGALFGHLILAKDLSIISVIGIVALSGIVVNDSLVLVDYINQQCRKAVSWKDAVLASGVRRFRAVILTSMTTFLGLLPIQLETSIQAQFIKPMAISVAFGVLFATLVTLLLVPCLCMIGDDLRRLSSRLKQAVWS